MRNSIVLGKIKGIDIELNYSWFIIFALITFTMATSFLPQRYPEWSSTANWILGALMSVMLLVSVLLHELSHSLVSQSLGLNVKKITLFIFGGIAQIEKEPDSPDKELKISIAGPLMSLAIALVSLLTASLLRNANASEVFIVPLVYVSNANFVLAIFNMMPAFPLDGGRVLRAIIWKIKGDLPSATKTASAIGGFFGYWLIFMGAFLFLRGNIINGIWFVFIGWFINQASQSSYQNVVMSDIFGKIKVKEFMSKNVITIRSNITVEDLVENYIYKYKFTCFPVTKYEKVIGIVNIEKVKLLDRAEWNQTTAFSIMRKLEDNLMVSPDDTVDTAMTKLFSNGIGRVVVVENDELLGIVSRTDILNHIRIYNQLPR